MSHELNRNKYDVISMGSFPWCSFANISPKQKRLSSATKHGLRARTSFTLVPGFSLPGQALPGHSSLLLRPALYPLPSFVSKFLEAEFIITGGTGTRHRHPQVVMPSLYITSQMVTLASHKGWTIIPLSFLAWSRPYQRGSCWFSDPTRRACSSNSAWGQVYPRSHRWCGQFYLTNTRTVVILRGIT